MNKYICIGGQYDNGKDIVGDILVKCLNISTQEKWIKNAFAEHLKNVCETIFGVDREFIEHWKRKEESPPGWIRNMRSTLIWLGDGARDSDPGIWMDRVFDRRDNQVICDTRYLNELLCGKDHESFNILIWRPGHENNKPNKSETELYFNITRKFIQKGYRGQVKHSLIDYFVVNDKPAVELEQELVSDLFPLIRAHYQV